MRFFFMLFLLPVSFALPIVNINSNDIQTTASVNIGSYSYVESGNCPDGSVVMNTTSQGVQCVILPVAGSANLSGSGTTNYIPYWTNSSNLGDSLIFQKDGKVSIGTEKVNNHFRVNGSTNFLYMNKSTASSIVSGWSYASGYVLDGGANSTGASSNINVYLINGTARSIGEVSNMNMKVMTKGYVTSGGTGSDIRGYVSNFGKFTSSGIASLALGMSDNSTVTVSGSPSLALIQAYQQGNTTVSGSGDIFSILNYNSNIAMGNNGLNIGTIRSVRFPLSGHKPISQTSTALNSLIVAYLSGDITYSTYLTNSGYGSATVATNSGGTISNNYYASFLNGIVLSNGKILNDAPGSFIHGYATTNGIINSSGFGSYFGSFIHGYAINSGNIKTQGNGATVIGTANNGELSSNADGAITFGYNTINSGSYAIALGSNYTNTISDSFSVGFLSTPTFFVNGNAVGINTTTPAYPLVVNSNISDISAWFQANISATGYITRTEVYDKKSGLALNQIKDSDEYLKDGKIDHEKFGDAYVSYNITKIKDYTIITKPQERCYEELNTTLNMVEKKCITVQIKESVPNFETVQEEGVDLVKLIAVMQQAIYELNQRLIIAEGKIK